MVLANNENPDTSNNVSKLTIFFRCIRDVMFSKRSVGGDAGSGGTLILDLILIIFNHAVTHGKRCSQIHVVGVYESQRGNNRTKLPN